MADSDIKLTVDLEPGDVTSAASTLQKRIKAIFDSSVGKELPKQFDNTARTLAKADTKANKLLKTIKELETTPTPEFNELKDSAKQIDTDLEKSKQKLVELNAQLAGYMQNRGVNSKDAVVYTDSWLRALDALRELKEKQQKIIDEKAEFESAFKDGPQEVKELVTETIGLYRQLQAEREKLESRKTSLADRDDEESGKEFLALHNRILKIDAELRNTANDINDIFKMAGVEANMTAQAFFESDEIIESFNEKIEEARQHLRDLKKEGLKFTTIENTATYENIAESIEETEKKVNQLTQAEEENRATREKMEMAGTNVIAGTSEKENYAEKVKELQLLNNDMVIYASRAEEMINKTNGVSDALEREIEELERESEKIRALMPQSILDSLANKLTQLADKIGQVDVKTKVLIPALKTAGKSALIFAKAITNIATGGFINRIKQLGASFGSLSKSTGTSNNALKVGFMTLLRYGLGIRSVYFLVKRLRSALGDGIKNLAQYSDGFNRTISQFISALTQLKNSFATAFAPIIEVVAPILTGFINLVSEAVSRIGMLIAALTGKKTFVRAKAVQEDFADSMNHAASSTNSANSAAERYKRTLAGFDDVEILKNPTSSSGSGGSGGGSGSGSGVNVNDMFETVDIPTGLEDWAAKIKEAWERADFTDLGRFLGEKIATALSNIPWDTIKQYASKFGTSFATFLNGLLSAPQLASGIGTTIGEAINTVFTGLNSFVKNINATTIGNFFADVMNTAVKTIQFNTIANTLSEAINKAFSAAGTWANKFKFSTLGTKIKDAVKLALDGISWETIQNTFVAVGTGAADFLNSVIDKNTFGSIGSTIANALNAAIKGVQSFAIRFDSDNLGTSVATAINRFFETFDFKKAGETFGTVITKIGKALTTAVSEVKWEDIGKDLTTFISSIPWKDVFGTAESLVTAVSEGAGEALRGVAEGIFEGINKGIDDYFKEHEGETGAEIAIGILKEIAKFFLDTVTWPYNYIVKPFVDGLCKGFNINSPAKEPTLLEAARNIGAGILNGIADKFSIESLKTWAETNILTPLRNAINPSGTSGITVNTAIQAAISLAKDGWATVSGWVKDKAENFGPGVEKAVGLAKGGWATVSGWIKDKAENFGTGVEKAVGLAKGGWKKVSNWLVEDDKWGDVPNKAVGLAKGGWKKVSNWLVEDTNNWGVTPNKAVGLAKSGWKKVSNWLVETDKWGGTPNKAVGLARSGWKKVSSWVKNDDNWGSIPNKAVGLARSGWKTVAKWVSKSGHGDDDHWGGSLAKAIGLARDGWKTVHDWVEEHIGSKITVGIELAKAGWNTVVSWVKKQMGKASGGAFFNGTWHNIAQYATGGTPRHGTVFVAGEAGAEAVGHIGGRTEVLNQSQMAAVMYSAVLNGTASLTKAITGHMTICTNATISNLNLLLTAFNFTSSQLYDIVNLVTNINTGLTDIVTGKVIPTQLASNSNEIVGALKELASKQNYVTRDEMQEIINNAFSRYLDITLYVGDEQVARHANAGNLKLSRRYNTV